jgi:hypothetical protein
MKCQLESLVPFLSEAVEASQCYFFKFLLIQLKCPDLLNVLLPSLKLEGQI